MYVFDNLKKNDMYSLHKKNIKIYIYRSSKSYNFLRIAVTLILLNCSQLFFLIY